MKVPLLDLKTQYEAIKDEVVKAIASVCDEQSFILGPQVREFEKAIEKFLTPSSPPLKKGGSGGVHAIGVASGSDALLISLMALDVGPGDEVITSPYTFFATAGSIFRLGARTVFADIDPGTFNISPMEIQNRITKKTKAIIPVHLFGQCAEMDSIMELARDRSIPVVEDAAQAIGAEYKGRKAGAIGDLGCFSFYPSKNLGGFGDGGMIVSGDEELARRVMKLRVHGSTGKYQHDMVGCNSRLDSIQAAVLRVKLRHLEGWTEARRKNAERYGKLFQGNGLAGRVTLPMAVDGARHVFNQFVIRVPRRDELRQYLAERGIGTEIYYPVPLHLQPCFTGLGYREGDLKESEKAARETLALPIYPELTQEMQEAVVVTIATFFSS